MTYYIALFPTLLLLFGSSFLIHLALDLLSDATDANNEVQSVEVVNFPDGLYRTK